jgi:hypothetical protein
MTFAIRRRAGGWPIALKVAYVGQQIRTRACPARSAITKLKKCNRPVRPRQAWFGICAISADTDGGDAKQAGKEIQPKRLRHAIPFNSGTGDSSSSIQFLDRALQIRNALTAWNATAAEVRGAFAESIWIMFLIGITSNPRPSPREIALYFH